MSDELNAEIARLKAANAKLAADLSDLSGELKETRGEARDRRHEARTLAEQVATLTTDRDTWKTQASTTTQEWQAKLDGLAGQLRTTKHTHAFESVLGTLNVKDPVKRADLLKLADYQAEGDEPDAARITEAFTGVLKQRPWLADAAEAAKPGAAASQQAPGGAIVTAAHRMGGSPSPMADRGQSLSSDAPKPASTKPPGRL